MSISEADNHRKAKLTLDVFKSIYQQEQLKLFYKCTPLHQKLFDVNLPNLPLSATDWLIGKVTAISITFIKNH